MASHPVEGPKTAATPQSEMAYALLAGTQISAIVAPPVARTGDPKKPVTNRMARSMPKLEDFAVGIWRATKTARVPI